MNKQLKMGLLFLMQANTSSSSWISFSPHTKNDIDKDVFYRAWEALLFVYPFKKKGKKLDSNQTTTLGIFIKKLSTISAKPEVCRSRSSFLCLILILSTNFSPYWCTLPTVETAKHSSVPKLRSHGAHFATEQTFENFNFASLTWILGNKSKLLSRLCNWLQLSGQ